MEILWLILKIIGIVLLVILAALLFAVILVVFYPVSYTLYAAYEQEVDIKAKVRWLFRLISVTFDYNIEGKKCVLRVMGIPVMDFLNPKPAKTKKKKRKKRRTQKPSQKKTESSQAANANAESDFVCNQNASLQTEHDFVQAEADRVQTGNASEQTETESKYTDSEQTEQKKFGKWKAFFAKLGSFPAKVKLFFAGLLKKLKALGQQLSDIKDTVDQWIEILSREQTKAAISKAKNQTAGLLKHILPRRWKAYVEFGFEDPAMTGKLLGYYWMFIGLWAEHFICVPDFENKVFKGSIRAKGHIQLIKFICVAWHVFFDKDFVYLRNLSSEIKSKKDF